MADTITVKNSGDIVSLTAGASVTLLYEAHNAMPMNCAYRWQAGTLPDGITLTQTPEAQVAMFASDMVSATLSADVRLGSGTYPARLQLMCDDQPDTELAISLLVNATSAEQIAAAQTAPTPPIPTPPAPIAPQPVVVPAPVPVTPKPEPVKPAPTPKPVVAETVAPVQPVSSKPAPAQAQAPAPKPPTPATPTPVAQPTPTPPAPTLRVAEVNLPPASSYNAPVAPNASAQALPKEWNEPNVLDAGGETAIPLRPGDTILFRFTVTNTVQPQTQRTYILTPDASLPREWFEFERQTHSLGFGGSNELSVRLRLPLSTAPGEYTIPLTVGEQFGAQKTHEYRVMVKATPAVKLVAKQATVTVGPLFPPLTIPFTLTVEKAGNADTAYRVAVLPPDWGQEALSPVPAGAARPALKKGVGAIEESGNFRYVFDHELENLVSPGYGQQPPPEEVKFAVERKPGWWWWGFEEKQTVYVQAVPVTDPLNGGRGDNTVALTAVRKRFLPFPGVCLVPLILLLPVFFGGRPSNFQVTNATYTGSDNRAYVVADTAKDGEKVAAQVKWDAPWFVPITLTADGTPVSGGKAVIHDFAGDAPDKPTAEQELRVANMVGAYERIKVVFVKANAQTPLVVSRMSPNGATEIAIGAGGKYTLTVPRTGYVHLRLRNAAGIDKLLKVLRAEHPDAGSGFSIKTDITDGLTIDQNKYKDAVIGYSGTGTGTGRYVLVTTDASQPKIEITLTVAQ